MRVRSALIGFRQAQGHWPSAVVLHPLMATNIRSLFRPENLARIEAKLQLIEGDVDLLDAMFFVEDAEGRRMSYGETNHVEL